MEDFDVVIVGKTVVGLALACGLSPELKIAVLNDYDNNFDNNNISTTLVGTSMISLAASRLLRYLKIWDNYVVNYVNPYKIVNISEANSFNSFTFNRSHLGYPCLGYIIDDSVLYRILLYRAHEFKNIYFIDNVHLWYLINKQDKICISVDKKNKFSARLLVVTSSHQNSCLYQNLDVSLMFQKYSYCILVGTLVSEYSHDNIVHYCFCKNDMLVLLPLVSPNYSFIFYLLYLNKSNYLLGGVHQKNWETLLMKSFNRLGKISFQDDVHFVPCISQYVRNFFSSRVLLLGDASYDVSFFKYQNINRGLMDVAILLESMNKCKNFFCLEDIGHPFCLRMYQKSRRYAIIKTFSKMECLRSCFLGTNMMAKYIRTLIFEIMNSSLSITTSLHIMHDLIGFNDIPDWLLTEYYD